MSATLIVRSRVRRRAREVAAEWQLQRQRIPSELLDVLEEDFNKQITIRVMAMLGGNPKVRSTRIPRSPKRKAAGPINPQENEPAASAG